MSRLPSLERSLRDAAGRLSEPAVEPVRAARPKRVRSRWRLVLVAAATCLVVSGAALASGLGPKIGDEIRQSASQEERDYAFSKFSVFSDESLRPRDAREVTAPMNRTFASLAKRLPAGDRERLGPRFAPLDPDKTRLARAHDPRIYLLASDHTVCLLVREEPGPTGGGGCTDPYVALGRDGLVGSMSTLRRGFRLTVLAPDSIRTVTVERLDGTSIVLPLRNNVTTRLFVRKPRSMTATDDQGTVHRRLFRRN